MPKALDQRRGSQWAATQGSQLRNGRPSRVIVRQPAALDAADRITPGLRRSRMDTSGTASLYDAEDAPAAAPSLGCRALSPARSSHLLSLVDDVLDVGGPQR